MEITWFGLSCFKMTERGMATVVTDPYDHRQAGFQPLKLSADIVTISHDAPGHNYLDAIQGTPYVITGPGEYEVGGVFITGIQTDGHKTAAEGHASTDSQVAAEARKSTDPNASADGRQKERNTLYVFDFDSLTVAHLGDLDHIPSQSEIEALGTVNIALVPIGSSGALNASRAAEVISLLEPSIVIPMHYATPESKFPLDSLNKFLKEMGISEVETFPSLKISSTALPEETKVIVLEYQRG